LHRPASWRSAEIGLIDGFYTLTATSVPLNALSPEIAKKLPALSPILVSVFPWLLKL